MSTYQIRNISSQYKTTFISRDGRPLRMVLRPGEMEQVLQQELANWAMPAKQDLAKYVQKGLIRVDEMDTVHVVPDKAHVLTVTASGAGAFDLASAIATANAFKATYNSHIDSVVFHDAQDAANVIAAADATNLATMITLLTEAQTDYDLHIASGVFHPNADTKNVTSAAVPTDLPTSIVAINELYALFNSHLLWATDAAAGPLTPLDIIAL